MAFSDIDMGRNRPDRFKWQDKIATGTGAISAGGYLAVVLLAGTFGYWALTAPISGAVVASGTVAAAGRNVQMQHLEGGVVKEVLVEEGESVVAGQPLFILDETSQTTLLNRLDNQIEAISMQMLRLEAERDGLLEMPETASAQQGPSVHYIEQRKEFEVRLDRYLAEQDMLNQRVGVYEETLVGLRAQKDAVARQLEVVREELAIKQSLLDRGLVHRTEYTSLLQTEANLIGEAAAIEAQLATAIGRVAESSAEIERHITQRVEEAIAGLNEARTQLLDLQEQVVTATAALDRTVMRAPTDGIVVASLYNTVGSVLSPGEKVLEILPTLPHLIVEAKISTNDVRRVYTGQPARLRLTALNQRLTPEVAGTVIHVSADRLYDQAEGFYYYLVRFMIDEELPSGVSMTDLTPGMPVDAMMLSDSRTFAEYLIRPILDSVSRAFTEE